MRECGVRLRLGVPGGIAENAIFVIVTSLSRRFRGRCRVVRVRRSWRDRGERRNVFPDELIAEVSGKVWMLGFAGGNLGYAEARQNWAAR